MNSCHQVCQEMAAVLLSDRYELIMFVFQIEAGDGVSAAMDQLQQDNVSDWVLGFSSSSSPLSIQLNKTEICTVSSKAAYEC